jgi:hypothetical protein
MVPYPRRSAGSPPRVGANALNTQGTRQGPVRSCVSHAENYWFQRRVIVDALKRAGPTRRNRTLRRHAIRGLFPDRLHSRPLPSDVTPKGARLKGLGKLIIEEDPTAVVHNQ